MMKNLGDITKINGAEIEPVDIITEEKIYKVYKYTFPDGKVYIGTTKNTLQERKDCGYQHNKKLTDAIRKVGWQNVRKDIIASGLDQSEAFEEEKRQIALYDSRNENKGYNISLGGKSTFLGLTNTDEHRHYMSNLYKGRKFSAETRKRMSLAQKGKRTGADNPMYGKPKSMETIQKQYDSHRNEMKPIVQFTKEGQFVARYDSVHQASKATGVARSSISGSATGKHVCQRFDWIYEEEVTIG